MREILFKAKRLDNGECVDGFYCCIGPVGQEKHYIIPMYASAFYGIEVDPSTVCQYTGLTDKNGKKIFDGDVVRRETDYYGKHKVYDEPVVWEDDIEKGFLGEPYTSGYCIHGGNWEVIGSIHDGEGGNHA
ncbi:YopX protein [uncultured Oscillibacter sp.]|uniref:YopX family protein n=1 Tax=uncultured Oscillibacter sp. TaxID=876091 RepID=UPI000820C10D|nr:YopX family protein [uncultured Oscillibacter sp.]SCI19858.1 YopX protein [uncultured Oscillibacter sp.]